MMRVLPCVVVREISVSHMSSADGIFIIVTVLIAARALLGDDAREHRVLYGGVTVGGAVESEQI